MKTDLKKLMEDGVDVTEVYTKIAEIVELGNQAVRLNKEIEKREKEIKTHFSEIIKESETLSVDLLNGTHLIIDGEDMWLEAE